MNKLTCLLVLLPEFVLGQVTVGPVADNDCDYNSIQGALDSGASEVRISSATTYEESLSITQADTTLIGGYSNCLQAELSVMGNDISMIVGDVTTTAPVVEINTPANSSVNLDRLSISSSGSKNGIHMTGEATHLVISNSLIFDNGAARGAGIYLNSQNSQVVIHSSQIINNQATEQGGGIYCENTQLILDHDVLVAENSVQSTVFGLGKGGGLYAKDCTLNLFNGNSDQISAGFIDNQASSSGGGVYAEEVELNASGYQLDIGGQTYGDSSQPMLFKGNVSDSDNNNSGSGGGLHLLRSEAQISAIWFAQNSGSDNAQSSFNKGGAFHIAYSTMTIGAVENQTCWRTGLCNLISGNVNTPIYVQRTTSELVMDQVEFKDNQSDTTGLIWLRNQCCLDAGDGPEFTLTNSLLHHNTTTSGGTLIRSTTSENDCCEITINGYNNTIADNDVNPVGLTKPTILLSNQSNLNWYNGIIWDDRPEATFLGLPSDPVGVELNLDCLLVAENNWDIPTAIIGNPQFINPTNGDYHISANSPAIDVCQNDIWSDSPDIDGQQRNVDHVPTQNILGTQDLGVDEYHTPDLIFADGFNGF